MMLLAARHRGDGARVLEHARRRQRSARARRHVGDVQLGRPRVVVDARVHRGFLGVRLAAHDYPETTAVTLKAT